MLVYVFYKHRMNIIFMLWDFLYGTLYVEVKYHSTFYIYLNQDKKYWGEWIKFIVMFTYADMITVSNGGKIDKKIYSYHSYIFIYW